MFSMRKPRLKDSHLITAQLHDQLTDDRVFGKLAPLQTLEDFFDIPKLEALRREVSSCEKGMILVVGTGASLVTEGDAVVYFDLPRREIEKPLYSRDGQLPW